MPNSNKELIRKGLEEKRKKKLYPILDNAPIDDDYKNVLKREIENGEITGQHTLKEKINQYKTNKGNKENRIKREKRKNPNTVDKITNKEELKKEITEEKIKTDLRRIVNESNLDYISQYDLISKINNDKITNKEELKKEITEEKNKTDLRRIVNESNLDYNSRKNLLYKINNDKITKETQRRIEYIKIINESNLDNTSKENLISKIIYFKIINKEELKKEITEEKNKTDLRRIVNESNLDYNSRKNLLYKINNDKITNKEELKKEITEEKNKTDLRRIVNSSNLVNTSKENIISKINNDKITNKEELKKEILNGTKKPWAVNKSGSWCGIEYYRFLEFKEIVNEELNLDNTSRRRLVSEVEYGLITTKYELKNELNRENKKTDLRRELIKIVNDYNLDNHSQQKLISKINKSKIINKDELKVEISEEIKRNEEKKIEYEKKEILKNDLIKIVNDSNLNPKAKAELISQIRSDTVSTKSQVEREIQNEERKIEYKKIVNEEYGLDDTSRWKLELIINNNEIRTKEELNKEITKEKKKTDLRIKSAERMRRKEGQSDSYHPNANKPWKY